MDIKQAKDELAKGLRVFKAFEHGVEVLRLLEISEQTAKEHEKATAAHKKEGEALKADNISAKERLAASISEAGKVLHEANEDANSILEEARGMAKDLKEKAEKALSDILKEDGAANRRLRATKADLKAKGDELLALEAKIASAKKAMTSALKGL